VEDVEEDVADVLRLRCFQTRASRLLNGTAS
jgi:hypothetical protein